MKTITFKLDDAVADRSRQLAEAQGLSYSAYVRSLIIDAHYAATARAGQAAERHIDPGQAAEWDAWAESVQTAMEPHATR